MTRGKSINPMAVRDCIMRTARRFPLTVSFTLLFAIFTLVTVWHPQLLASSASTDLLAYFMEGAVLSFAMKIWDERTGHRHLWQHIAGQILLLALALIWLDRGFVGEGLVTAHLSIMLSLLVACVFLPFTGETDDIPAVNFGLHLAKQAIIAPYTGFFPTLILCILVNISFPLFFDIVASRKDYYSIIIFFQIVLPMLLFLSRIFKGKRLTNRAIKLDPFVQAMMRMLIVPLATCYICILYCYECHIALAWELPNGGVASLIAVMMGFYFLIEFYLFFINREGIKPTSGWFMRWLPLLVMPLLILMSIGIWRRIYDYGITATRLYLATLNAWFYVACCVMFFTKLRRINWIPISFCAIFLLTSVLPINYNSIARDYILKDIHEKKEKGIDKMTNAEREDWSNRVNYMEEYYQIKVYTK